MIIKALAENTSVSDDLGCEHGLSLYIETAKHKILFDTGVEKTFAENARLMGVDLSGVDIAFLSHGHYDHGGGLKTFLQLNSAAQIYVSRYAFEKHFADFGENGIKYIGLDETLPASGRFVTVGDRLTIDSELELFSAVRRLRLNSKGNDDLLKQKGNSYERDDFNHEQDLVIREGGKEVMLAGCAHCGIVNILEHYHSLFERYPDTVIGGFHLYNPTRDAYESPELVREIAEFLLQTNAQFYTCHCTGLESYKRLKESMGDKIGYLSGGMTLNI